MNLIFYKTRAIRGMHCCARDASFVWNRSNEKREASLPVVKAYKVSNNGNSNNCQDSSAQDSLLRSLPLAPTHEIEMTDAGSKTTDSNNQDYRRKVVRSFPADIYILHVYINIFYFICVYVGVTSEDSIYSLTNCLCCIVVMRLKFYLTSLLIIYVNKYTLYVDNLQHEKQNSCHTL